MRILSHLPIKAAPHLIGAFFLATLLSGCDRQNKETARWVGLEDTLVVAKEIPATEQEEEPVQKDSVESEEEICFLSYNLKNYLTMRRGKVYTGKPEKEIDALIDIIVDQKPDILGVCEIGTEADLLDLQARLYDRGIKLNHHEHTGGYDKTRRQGLLSRFPIVERDSQTDSSYELNGKTYVISRGILDATVDTGPYRLRLLGLHLKSKREVSYADQNMIRQNEAHIFREHASRILKADPDVMLLAYGDFNDTIGSKTLQILRGRRNSKMNLPDFYFKDDRDELWTHFWDHQDVYSRFDYVLFSDAVRPHLRGKASGIVDDPSWATASDHRALRLILK